MAPSNQRTDTENDEVVTLSCPWCDAPAAFDGDPEAFRCDVCSVVVELAEAEPAEATVAEAA